MVAHSDWQALKVELRNEAQSMFCSMGDIALNRTPPLYDTDEPTSLEIPSVDVRLARVSGNSVAIRYNLLPS